MSNDILYPLLVFRARYSGIYEGGKWVALNAWEIPYDAHGSDCDCAEWFGEHEGEYGFGETPDEAISCLRTVLAKHIASSVTADKKSQGMMRWEFWDGEKWCNKSGVPTGDRELGDLRKVVYPFDPVGRIKMWRQVAADKATSVVAKKGTPDSLDRSAATPKDSA